MPVTAGAPPACGERRHPRTLILVAFVVGGLVLAACSGASSPGVASLGATTTTTSPTAGGNTGVFGNRTQAYNDLLAYSQCMRTHGVASFPDPTITGHSVSLNAAPVDKNSAQFKAANKACAKYQPNGGRPPSAAQIAALTTRLLKYAKCMRSHGAPNFPDPVVNASSQGLEIRIGGPGLDRSSAGFQSAQKACQSLFLFGQKG